MADVSNLIINERSNVEQPNIRVTKIGNKTWENWFISKGWESAKLRVVRNIESKNNSKIVIFEIFGTL